MTLLSLRQNLRAWLDSWVRIQVVNGLKNWDLDVPPPIPVVYDAQRYPANSAVEMPIENFTTSVSSVGTTHQGLFAYIVVWRFGQEAAKDQLPIDQVENLLVILADQAVQSSRAIDPAIQNIEIADTRYPIKLGRVDGENGDWLVSMELAMQITWTAGQLEGCIDFGVLQPEVCLAEPIQPAQLAIGLNRSLVPVVTPDEVATWVKDRDIEVLLNYSE